MDPPSPAVVVAVAATWWEGGKFPAIFMEQISVSFFLSSFYEQSNFYSSSSSSCSDTFCCSLDEGREGGGEQDSRIVLLITETNTFLSPRGASQDHEPPHVFLLVIGKLNCGGATEKTRRARGKPFRH